jgi:uroporphyrinogen decarboxylase
MNREERIMAALDGKPVDRVPVSAWMHFSEYDQDPVSLAKAQAEFNEKYDFDFIKMMPFGLYSTQDWGNQLKIYCHPYHEPIVIEPLIKKIDDYYTLDVLPPYCGTYGKQLELTKHLSKIVAKNTPYVQTIFSPLSTLAKLSNGKVYKDLITNPNAVHRALRVVTETTIAFVKANIPYGVAGFFFATQSATSDNITLEQFKEFGEKYDLDIINEYKNITYFNVIHIHGSNIFFDEIAQKYPINCLNWHDRHTKPSLKEAREKYNTCFLGGINEVPWFLNGVLQYDSIMRRSTSEEIGKHVKEAIQEVNGLGFILGPGCVVDPQSPEANLYELRKIVEES